MSDQITFKVSLFSPRWSHEDLYEIKLNKDKMYICFGLRTAECSWIDGKDPKWSGHTVKEILTNEFIYPPTIFEKALEKAWEAWKDSDLDDVGVQKEVKELCDWVNTVSRNRPKTNFWKLMFG